MRIIRVCLTTCFAIVLIDTSFSQEIPDHWDIRGIKAGMGTETVQKKMMEIGSGQQISSSVCDRRARFCYPIRNWQLIDYLDLQPYVSTLQLSGSEYIMVTFLPPPGDMGAAVIRRQVRYTDGQKPTAENTVAALIEKYGVPTHQTSDRDTTTLAWEYDVNGKPIAVRPQNRYSPGCGVNTRDGVASASYPGGTLPEVLCDYSMFARIGTTSEGLVNTLWVTITDVNKIYTRTQEIREAISQAESGMREQELENAKNKKPIL